MKLKLALYFILLLIVSGLNAAEETESGSAGEITLSPSSDGAAVEISNLSDGAVLPTTFVAKFSVSGMGIAPAGTRIDNTGHFYLLIDVETLPPLDRPLPSSEVIRPYDQGQANATLTLAEGEHSLQLLLADYRHIPHDPPVISEAITIVVSADAPPQENENKD